MKGLERYHTGDDELLIILLDAPNRWMVRCGTQSALASSLRHALCKAHELSSGGIFSGRIIKQPNDEMIIDACQARRMFDYLGYNDFKEMMVPQVLGIAYNPVA